MARWTIGEPTTRTLDGIVALRVRIVSGRVNILPTDDPVTFELTEIKGEPLLVSQEAGILTITYEDLTREGFLDRLRPIQLGGYRSVHKRSATVSLRVPHDCPVTVTTATASVVAAGLTAKSTLRTASGDITLDNMGGTVEANTASGNLDIRDISGGLRFNSAAGNLAVAGGRVSDFAVRTGTGQVLADVDIAPAGRVSLSTVSGEIALRVPAETSATVEMRAMSGDLNSAFALDRTNATGRNQLAGKIGSGVDPASITTTTVSGTSALLRRAPEAPAAIPRGTGAA